MNTTRRILLINPKDSSPLGSPPLGVGYLMSYSQAIGRNEVRFHDENFIGRDRLDRELDRVLAEFAPHFVGITFPSSPILRVVAIAERLRTSHQEITVFAGGYHPTSEPEATLRAIPGLDFIVLGQAENTFAHIGDDWRNLDSVAYVDDTGAYVQTDVRNAIPSLDAIPYIDRTIYDARYFEPGYAIAGVFGRTATLMSSRGCPYNCGFCSNRLLQKRVTYHSIEYTLGEIERVLGQLPRTDQLFFLDVNFLARRRRTEELCAALMRSNVLRGIRWAATVSAEAITDSRARLLREAGCFYLSFGFESNSAASLALMNKRARPADNERAAEACEKAGILYNSAFLFGIPGETERDLMDTIEFVRRHHVFSTGVNIMKPLPGSPYYYTLVEEGVIDRTIDDWHRISAIDRYSGFYNERIPEEVYLRYVDLFNRTVRRRARRDHYRQNWRPLAGRRARSLLQRFYREGARATTKGG